MTNVPFLDRGLRSLHISLESFGARPVPDGEGALTELLDRLPDRETISVSRAGLKRRSHRRVRRVLAIAAALVVFGGSAFASVGGLAQPAFDALFRRHPVPVAPTPAPAPLDRQEPLGSAIVGHHIAPDPGVDDVSRFRGPHPGAPPHPGHHRHPHGPPPPHGKASGVGHGGTGAGHHQHHGGNQGNHGKNHAGPKNPGGRGHGGASQGQSDPNPGQGSPGGGAPGGGGPGGGGPGGHGAGGKTGPA